MAEQRVISKRRRWKRFIAKGGSIVLLHPSGFLGLGIGLTKPIELGPLINISQGGLMIQYVESKERLRKGMELSVSTIADGVQIEKVPFETVADFEVARMPEDKVIRNRSIRFGKLTPYQLFQIESFIEKYTTGLVIERRSGVDRRQKEDPEFENPEWNIKKDRRRGMDRRKTPFPPIRRD